MARRKLSAAHDGSNSARGWGSAAQQTSNEYENAMGTCDKMLPSTMGAVAIAIA
jgi:hypothetical protein